ncbi:prenyltransferase/squalene oxidase repeat-containing protein [Symmachiella dynata]|nr:prenyltransferase/squalene oxidase repeat-containing protein [Symmachiella dynata]
MIFPCTGTQVENGRMCLRGLSCIAGLLLWGAATNCHAAEPLPDSDRGIRLSPAQWQQLDGVVDRGLEYLSAHQQPDGSFEAPSVGQPAITSFCVMAFLSRGHIPGQGPYGEQLNRAIEYVLASQQPNGLLCRLRAGGDEWKMFGGYHHPIAGLMLGEVYGMTGSPQHARIRTAIEKALLFSRREQTKPRPYPQEKGGWRYLSRSALDADLSITAWQLMFLRSAKNAEFDIPESHIDEAVRFVRRCYDPQRGSFSYGLRGRQRSFFSRSMAGAGILSLSLAGEHQTDIARKTARFILDHPFDRFNRGGLTAEDRYYYGAYYCSQAMYQLGGENWRKFYPDLLQTFADNQRDNGAFDREANQDGPLGFCYSTSFAILALTPPYQLLPIYQR